MHNSTLQFFVIIPVLLGMLVCFKVFKKVYINHMQCSELWTFSRMTQNCSEAKFDFVDLLACTVWSTGVQQTGVRLCTVSLI